MIVCISNRKATAVAKKSGISLPDYGEEFLVGKLGNKLGCFSDPQPGTKYYIKIYGDYPARVDGMNEFNLSSL